MTNKLKCGSYDGELPQPTWTARLTRWTYKHRKGIGGGIGYELMLASVLEAWDLIFPSSHLLVPGIILATVFITGLFLVSCCVEWL